MTLLAKRILLFSLMLLLNANVYHPHHLYDGGYGGTNYNDGYDSPHGDKHKHRGVGYHNRRHH